LADEIKVVLKFDCPGGKDFMPSIEAGVSMLSKSMEDQKLIVQMLTDTVLQKVEAAAEEQSATLGTVIDETI
jgi:hypothetical protein